MTDEPQRQRSPLWMMGCMVLIAWIACGVYRRQVPPLTTARAVIQVPSATDIGTLCQRPEICQAAVERLESEGDLYITLEQPEGAARLSGTLVATKIKGTPSTSSTDPANHISTETWELTYRTPRSFRALLELTTLVDILEPEVVPESVSDANLSTEKRLRSQLSELETQQKATANTLQALPPAAESEMTDPIQLTNQQNRVQSLQKAVTEAQVQRLQSEEEWRLVEQEIGLNLRLDAIAAKLSAGPIQEAVLQVERQRKLSAELTRLNDAEQRLSDVYGDKHPRLLELRQKFEQLLTDLGGWDHVLNDAQVAERLQGSLERLLELKRQHAADLETQLELEQQELAGLTQQAAKRVALTTELEKLNQQVTAAQQSVAAAGQGGFRGFTVQSAPEIVPGHWSTSLELLMGSATLTGLLLGWMLHRLRPEPVSYASAAYSPGSYSAAETTPAPIPATLSPTPEPQIGLAQRRAMRQARLQQAYAS